MFTFNGRPEKRRRAEPAARVIARQRPHDGSRHAPGDPLLVVYGLLSLLVIGPLLVGTIMGPQRVAQVGDMLEFTAATVPATAPATTVPAQRLAGPQAAPSRDCALDVSAMAKPGGAMTVLALRADGVVLSWAGGATAPGAADCGDKGQIFVSNSGYRQLFVAQLPRPVTHFR